jgi:hypothetical protein
LVGGVQAIAAHEVCVGKLGCLEAAAGAGAEFCIPVGERGDCEGCGGEGEGEGEGGGGGGGEGDRMRGEKEGSGNLGIWELKKK